MASFNFIYVKINSKNSAKLAIDSVRTVLRSFNEYFATSVLRVERNNPWIVLNAESDLSQGSIDLKALRFISEQLSTETVGLSGQGSASAVIFANFVDGNQIRYISVADGTVYEEFGNPLDWERSLAEKSKFSETTAREIGKLLELPYFRTGEPIPSWECVEYVGGKIQDYEKAVITDSTHRRYLSHCKIEIFKSEFYFCSKKIQFDINPALCFRNHVHSNKIRIVPKAYSSVGTWISDEDGLFFSFDEKTNRILDFTVIFASRGFVDEPHFGFPGVVFIHDFNTKKCMEEYEPESFTDSFRIGEREISTMQFMCDLESKPIIVSTDNDGFEWYVRPFARRTFPFLPFKERGRGVEFKLRIKE